MVRDDRSLLFYAPVALHRGPEGTYWLEDQACNGLRLWADNFTRLIVMMPLDPAPPPPAWVPLTRVGPALDRIEIVPLPMAYRPDRFLRHLPAVRRQIRALIARADLMGFSIGGLFGDWGSVAAWQAHRMGRRFYVWTDRVESEVTRRAIHDGPWRHRLRSRLTYRPMAWLERFLIRRATPGLFHGRETYDTYAPHCRNPQLVHDIHIKKADHIAADALAAKVVAAGEGPLRLIYAGRAEPMKGPLDWLDVCAELRRCGVDFQATWLGSGAELERMRARVAAEGLAERVALPGFASDRTALLAALRTAHVFLFCHKTPESPRCLIEALVSGTPIIGYSGAFARDLITAHGGGVLVPLGDRAALAAEVGALAGDRGRLAALIGKAALDGTPHDDAGVFAHRSDLIRAYL